MSPASSARPATDALAKTTTSTLALLRRFISTLAEGQSENVTLPTDPPEPLDVLHTSATLLKAQTTKLSLLIINKPFTPSAIQSVINDAAGTCIPAIMSAVEICGARTETYGAVMYKEVRARVRRVFREMESLLQEVSTLLSSEREGTLSGASGSKRDSLASTGVVWEACDALMELKSIGLAGLVVAKAQSYREMLEDALTELKEWAEDEVSDDGLEEERHAHGSDESNGGNELDDTFAFGTQKQLPKSREDLKATLGLAFKKLRLTNTLYQAVIKRRLKTIPERPSMNTAQIQNIDLVVTLLKDVQEHADEVAAAFYALDNDTAAGELKEICALGCRIVNHIRMNWQGSQDEFTNWSDKWREAIEKE